MDLFFSFGANDSDSESEDSESEEESDGDEEDIRLPPSWLGFQSQPNPRLRISDVDSDSESDEEDESDNDGEDGEDEEGEEDEEDEEELQRLKETKVSLQKLTVRELKQRLRDLELPVSGRKAELIARQLDPQSSGKVKEWAKSKAKLLLVKLFDDARSRVYRMTAEEIYNSHPWFRNYPLAKFKSYLETIKTAAESLRLVVSEDEREIWSEIIAFPRASMTIRGYPFWDTHDARPLLEKDVRDGIAYDLEPKPLWKTRSEYLEFPLHVFRDHIHQEKRRQRAEPGWVVKRNKKAREMHEEEIEDKKKKWEEHDNEVEMEKLCEQWERL